MPPAPFRRRPETAILDLTFRVVGRWRPFALVAPGFEAVAEPRIEPGPMRSHATGPVAPFAAVEVTLPAARGEVALGLATRDDGTQGEHLLVRWSAARKRVTLEVRTGGRTRVLRRRRLEVHGPFRLAFALCESQVTALVGETDGPDPRWRPLLTERRRVAALLDLRRETVLRRFRYAWGTRGVTGSDLRAGLFGMTGLRDPHLVQHADGTPYERDGRQFLTWTCAGLGFFPQAHWSVWSFDPADPRDQRLESQLFTRRGGLVLGDHAGQLVRDGDRWLVATSAWGDFVPGSVHVRHTTTTRDLLSGTHLLETTRTPLPTRQGTWDPALTRVDGRWQVAYVESPSQDPFEFHPVLATGPGPEWADGLRPVTALGERTRCEGPVLFTDAGTTRLVVSDGTARRYPVLDLAGRVLGELDAPYPSNIPHPQLVPDPAGGWWLVTFDGTAFARRALGYGGHGDVVLMHSTPAAG